MAKRLPQQLRVFSAPGASPLPRRLGSGGGGEMKFPTRSRVAEHPPQSPAAPPPRPGDRRYEHPGCRAGGVVLDDALRAPTDPRPASAARMPCTECGRRPKLEAAGCRDVPLSRKVNRERRRRRRASAALPLPTPRRDPRADGRPQGRHQHRRLSPGQRLPFPRETRHRLGPPLAAETGREGHHRPGETPGA